MNSRKLVLATAVGTLVQVTMVLIGHVIIPVQSAFLVGGLLISAMAGALYARATGGSLLAAFSGGATAGGLCAFCGILVSFLLGDVPAPVLAFGTASSAVTGLVGAVVSRQLR